MCVFSLCHSLAASAERQKSPFFIRKTYIFHGSHFSVLGPPRDYFWEVLGFILEALGLILGASWAILVPKVTPRVTKVAPRMQKQLENVTKMVPKLLTTSTKCSHVRLLSLRRQILNFALVAPCTLPYFW